MPVHIRELYEIARGTMLYAYYYYPVMSLATEQLYRVADTALSERVKNLTKAKDFRQRICAAIEHGVIREQDQNSWEATRELRNSSSHPKTQSIVLPGQAITSLSITSDQINSLYLNL